MRARNIKPGFFKNEDLGQLPVEDRLLFAGLWCLADREGFFEYRPMRIAAEIFPYDKKIDGKKIQEMMQRLTSIHVVACNDGYGFIPSFLIHNKPHPHEAKCTVPEEIKKNLKNQRYSPNDSARDNHVITCNDMSLHGTPMSDHGVPMSDNVALNEECGMMNDESPLMNQAPQGVSFDDFWTEYPKKVAKKSARKEFSKIPMSRELLAKIIASIRRQITSEQWSRDGGKYIPHPATWLNGRRWEDEDAEVDADELERQRYAEHKRKLAETEEAAKRLFGE